MMVADPLQLFDCCPFSDGAAAVVVAEAGKAKEFAKKPVYIAGMGQASGGPLYLQKDLSRVMAREASIAQAYKESGLGPDDIDVVELHDCFTIAEILALESFGLYEFGKAYDAATKRETYLGGKVVVNPSGGLKAKGHPIGATGGRAGNGNCRTAQRRKWTAPGGRRPGLAWLTPWEETSEPYAILS